MLRASSPPTKTLLNPNVVRNYQWRFHLKPYICARARSIITVNSCLIYCQRVADGQELSAHLGVSNTPESTDSVPGEVFGDGRREPRSKAVVHNFAAENILYISAGGGINPITMWAFAIIPTSDHHPSPQGACSRWTIHGASSAAGPWSAAAAPVWCPSLGYPWGCNTPLGQIHPAHPRSFSHLLHRGGDLVAEAWHSDDFPHSPIKKRLYTPLMNKFCATELICKFLYLLCIEKCVNARI